MDEDTSAIYDVRPTTTKKWTGKGDPVISFIHSTQQSYPSKTYRKWNFAK
jgi:hypothetical protein